MHFKLLITLAFLLAVLNAVVRFWGEWSTFAGLLCFQALILATVVSYYRQKTMYLGFLSVEYSEENHLYRNVLLYGAGAGFFLFF